MCNSCNVPPSSSGFSPEVYVKSILLLAQPNEMFFSPELHIEISAYYIRDLDRAKSLIPNEHWKVIGPEDMDEVIRLISGFHLVICTELEQHFHRFQDSDRLDSAFSEMRNLYKALITK